MLWARLHCRGCKVLALPLSPMFAADEPTAGSTRHRAPFFPSLKMLSFFRRLLRCDHGEKYEGFSRLQDLDGCEPELQKPAPRQCWLSLLFSGGLLVACFSSWVLGIWTARTWVRESDCLHLTSVNCKSGLVKTWLAWSMLTTTAPILEESPGMSVSPVLFNGSFLQENIFRKEAGPEVDAAWTALGVDCLSHLSRLLPSPMHAGFAYLFILYITTDRPSAVPEIYAELSGIPSGHVRVSPKYGGGFIANVEGLHHLHCLVSTPFVFIFRVTEFPS